MQKEGGQALATQRKVVLLGPYPPPHGGVAIFTSGLFEFVRDDGVELWTAGEKVPREPSVSRMNYKHLGLIPLLIRKGRRARIIDSFYFLIEYPSPLMVPLWVILKLLLRFDWVKVVHDGSLPSRYGDFGPVRKTLFRLSAGFVDEFVVVNDGIGVFLRDQIGVRQRVSTVNALLPIPDAERHSGLPADIESALESYDRCVVSTGVFIPSYGFAHAAEAVERIRRASGKNVGLILIDGAFVHDEHYRTAVLANRDWITVLEKVPHAQVLEIFRRSNVFVRGFQHEGYGLSRIEAVWCGIPVIAALGEESRGMLLYKFGDLEALTRHLRQALFDPSEKEIQCWAQAFQSQAEENLERWKAILEICPPKISSARLNSRI